jgi:nitrogen fixation/metabolism regulation signal transduction histidine kinase
LFRRGIRIGQAVVKKIADLHHAQIELREPEKHPGLQVAIKFLALANVKI